MGAQVLIRYKTGKNGKLIQQAEVYTREEHSITRQGLDPDAVKVVRRLQKAGYETYIVGGAVRDLLLGKLPKDFDISTAAEPNQIRRLFRNSRIIGKRFRLVHVFYRDRKIIEVSTFRSAESRGFENIFGEIEEDALRRDFSMNALYYDPVKEQLIDFVSGFKDIKEGRLRNVIPLGRIFVEDPVRIIRAVKYSVKTGLKPGFFLRRKIRGQVKLLAGTSYSRLTEEIYKVLASGDARRIFESFIDLNILSYVLPHIQGLIANPHSPAPQELDSRSEQPVMDARTRFLSNLGELDSHVQKHNDIPRNIMLKYLVKDYVLHSGPWAGRKKIPHGEVYKGIKELMKPVVPPNKDVEDVISDLLKGRHDGSAPARQHRRRRQRRPRKRGRVHGTIVTENDDSKGSGTSDS